MGAARSPSTIHSQAPLFGRSCAPPDIDPSFAGLQRTELRHGAWLEIVRGWVRNHAGLFDALAATTAWRSETREMYDRNVEVPRQLASFPEEGSLPAFLETMRVALSARYAEDLKRVTMALYRDGHDSVAWHGDTTARDLPTALVATVSVGAPRKFLLKPTEGGASLATSLGWGDLLVMGGTCQRTYRHSIPKVAQASPRIAIMFRPVWVPIR